MINFRRNGTEIVANINTNLPVATGIFPFSFDEGKENEAEALLVTGHLQKELDETVQAIRRKAYRQGLEDGRKRRKTLKEFTVPLDPNCEVGW